MVQVKLADFGFDVRRNLFEVLEGFITDEAKVVASYTSDVLEAPIAGQHLQFQFTTNTGAGASTAWTLEGSIDGSTWVPLKTGTLVGDVAAALTDHFNGQKAVGVAEYPSFFPYLRISYTVSGATHTFGCDVSIITG